MQMTGQQLGQFNDVLLNAFTPQTLQRMLTFRLNKGLYNYAPVGGNFQDIVYAVVDAADREGWIEQFIARAREANPGNGMLLAFSQQFGLASIDKPRQELERVVIESNSFLDVDVWREKLGEIETKICRIEIETDQGKVLNGTGFLFGGPDVVLTNYHVMEPVLAGRNNGATSEGLSAKAANVICRFDYKRTKNGSVLNPGVEYQLADDWYLDESANSPLDEQTPPPDHLDYALFKIAGAPGEAIVGGKDEPGGIKRSYLPMPSSNYGFPADSTIFIMQHPNGKPLKLALDTKSVIGLNGNGTRVMYRTNTEPGSSGSPCFTQDWDLVALHHSGDPDFDPDHKPTYNEGIPISAIVSLLKKRGVDKKMGEEKL